MGILPHLLVLITYVRDPRLPPGSNPKVTIATIASNWYDLILMANKSDSLKQYVSLRQSLLAEKQKLEARLQSINAALGGPLGGTGRKKPFLSPAARAKIAAAQRARWAKVRAAKSAAKK